MNRFATWIRGLTATKQLVVALVVLGCFEFIALSHAPPHTSSQDVPKREYQPVKLRTVQQLPLTEMPVKELIPKPPPIIAVGTEPKPIAPAVVPPVAKKPLPSKPKPKKPPVKAPTNRVVKPPAPNLKKPVVGPSPQIR